VAGHNESGPLFSYEGCLVERGSIFPRGPNFFIFKFFWSHQTCERVLTPSHCLCSVSIPSETVSARQDRVPSTSCDAAPSLRTAVPGRRAALVLVCRWPANAHGPRIDCRVSGIQIERRGRSTYESDSAKLKLHQDEGCALTNLPRPARWYPQGDAATSATKRRAQPSLGRTMEGF
jgi:hypothetical protein